MNPRTTQHSITVSIVIPCFNHGQYIQEALDSIDFEKINYNTEIIIVDDGSSDDHTLQKLEQLKQLNYTIIHQTNGGPGKARNTGIEIAVGKYILPLDADNKLNPDYINKAVPLLEKKKADIVYAAPVFFGDTSIKNRQFKVRPFDDLGLVTGNCADACAIFRKEVWVKNGGYDAFMPSYGFEDWDLVNRALLMGWQIVSIKSCEFNYRVRKNGMFKKVIL